MIVLETSIQLAKEAEVARRTAQEHDAVVTQLQVRRAIAFAMQ